MLGWLERDLASTNQPWIIAYWHHPPYSKGSHDSDTEIELVQMRENVLPILEAAGVDLVLSGHSHSYERSFLIDGHYGPSSTFSAAMKKNGGSGRADGAGAYRKSTFGMAPHEGTVYVVAGTSGQASAGALDYPAMYTSMSVPGSFVVDVNGNRLDATFLDSTGVRRRLLHDREGGDHDGRGGSADLARRDRDLAGMDPDWVEGQRHQRGRLRDRAFPGRRHLRHRHERRAEHRRLQQHRPVAVRTKDDYRVRAFRGSPRVNSAWSNVASATTPTS